MFRLRTVVTIAIGYGAGYVVGAKAGRPAYERLAASLGTVGNQLGVTRSGSDATTSTDATNDELTRLRAPGTNGVPGKPDDGRDHAAIITPSNQV